MARHYVTLPVEAFNSFDLPPICFITGEREGVVWRKKVFRWTPPWILLLIICFPVGVLVSVWLHRAVRVQVPVTEAARVRWLFAEQAGGLAVLGALLGGFAAFSFAATGSASIATALAIASAVFPLGLFVVAWRYQGPRVRRIDEAGVELVLRREAVADALRAHFDDLLVEAP